MSRLVVLCVVMLVMGLPAQAIAQAPTGEQYSEDDISTLSSGDPRDPGTGGSLPFSGFDAALVGAAGVLLAGAGLGMRRLTRVADSS